MITAMNSIVQDASESGNALKVLSMRLRGATSDLEGMGEETDGVINSVSTLRDTIKSLTNTDGSGGFDIMADDGSFKSTYDIMQGIAKVWQQISDVDQANLLQIVAGKQRGNDISALLTQMSQASDVLNTSLSSSGSAYSEQEKWLNSLEAKVQQFQAAVESLSSTLVDSDLLKFFVDLGTTGVNSVDNLISTLGTLPTLLATVSGALSATTGKGIFELSSDGSGIVTSLKSRQIAQVQATAQLETDIAALANYEKAVVSGSVSTKQFATIMQGASVSAKEYAVETNGATGSSETFAAKQKATNSALLATGEASTTASLGMKALSVAANVGVMLLITEAIKGISWALDQAITTTKEYKEKVEESSTAYENAKTELESVNQQLEEQNTQMQELLAKDKLTYAEKGQLDELQEITKELQVQQDILEKQKASSQKDLAVNAANAINSQYDLSSITASQVSEYQHNASSSGNNAILISDENNISSMIAGYKEFIQLRDEAYSSENTEEYQNYVDMTDDISSSIWDSVSALQEQQSYMQEYYDSAVKDESLGKILTSDQQKVISAYDGISNAIKLVYTQLEPDKWNDMQISNILSSEDIEKTKTQLVQLAKEGKLSTDTIASYENLNKAIDDSELILSDGTRGVQAFVKEIYALASSEDSASDSSQNASNSTDDQTESLYSLAEAAEQATGYVNNLGENVDISNLQDAISNSQSAVEDYKTILSDMDEYNGLTSDGLDTITQKYPKLLAYVGNEQELRKQLQQGIEDQQASAEDYYKEVLELDTDFYNTVIKNNSDLVNELSEYYGVDLANFKSLAQAKNETETTLLSSLKQKWADYYKAQAGASAIQSAASNSASMYDSMGLFLGDSGLSDKAVENAKKIEAETKAAAEKESAMYKQMQKLFEDTDYTDLNIDGIKTAGNNAGSSGKSSKESVFSEQLDWASETTQKLENEISNLNKTLANTTTLNNQNEIYDKLIDKQTELAAAYKNTANTYSTEYTKALSKLSDSDKKKVQSGTYTIEQFSGTGENSADEKRYNNIQKAIELRDELSSANGNVSQAIADLKSYATELADIPWDNASKKVDTLNSDIDLLNAQLDNTTDLEKRNELLDKILDKQTSIVTTYKNAVKENQDAVDELYSQIDKKDRVNSSGKSVKSGTKISTEGIAIGSDEYTSIVLYNKAIDELIENSATLALEEEKLKGYVSDTNSEIASNNFDDVTKKIEKYTEAISNLQDLADDYEEGSDEQFIVLSEAVKKSSDEVEYLEEQIAELNKVYKNDKDNETYREELETLTDALDDANSVTQDLLDTMADALESNLTELTDDLTEAYEDQTDAINDAYDAYEKLINAKKAALEADKEAADYADDIADKTETISDIQNRMSELELAANSGDRSAAAELKDLQEQLADAQEDLDDTVADHKLDTEEDALDKSLDNYKDITDQQLEDAETVYNDKSDKLKSLYAEEEELIKHASEYTQSEFATKISAINDEIQSIISDFNDAMDGSVSGGVSDSTENSITDAQADVASNNSSTTSGTKKASILSILEGGTSKTGDSELNKYIKSKYGTYLTFDEMVNLAQALGLSDINDASDVKGNSKNRELIRTTLISAGFKTGGTVDASNTYSELANSIGEDGIAFVKHNEEILTPEKASLISDLLDNIQPLNDLASYLSKLDTSNMISNNTSSNIEINIASLLSGVTVASDYDLMNGVKQNLPKITDMITKQISSNK